jgi:hypothetical protein
MGGFLGVAASSFRSDATLLVEIAFGLVLVVGLVAVRLGHVRLHMYLQSSVVLVNLPVVLYAMVPSYLQYVLPSVPADLAKPFYLWPTVMLFLGATAEALGVYILLVAGTNWLPERWRFRRYKLVMRTELALWWLVLLVGFTTYYVWYVQP